MTYAEIMTKLILQRIAEAGPNDPEIATLLLMLSVYSDAVDSRTGFW